MKLRFLNGHFQGRVMEIKPGEFTIGRGPDNALAIDAEGISRRHCVITSRDGTFYIEDLQSTNGVRLNGRRIGAREAISAGDHLGLGPFVLQVIEMDESAPPLPPPARPADAIPPAPVAKESPAKAETAPVADALEKAPFPWGRSAVLALLFAAIGYLLIITLRTPAPAPVQKATPGSAGAPAPVAAVPGVERGAGATTGGAPIPGVEKPAAQAANAAAEDAPAAAAKDGGKAEPADVPAPRAERAEVVQTTSLLVVTSEPAGAALKLDGVEKGITPVTLVQVPNGRHTITLTRAGYDEFVRQIHLPFVAPDKPYILRQKPGTLLVTSVPVTASVRYGPRILGMTPVLVDDLPDGDYELRVTALGYDTAKVKASINSLRPEVCQVTLQGLMGDLEIVTYPVGCDVFVDDALLGRSQASPATTQESQPVIVRNLLEGEHEVRIQHPLGTSTRTRAAVVKHETKRVSLRLFVVDTELTLTDGSKRYGMLVEKNQLGDVILAESSKRLERYLKPQIAKLTPVTVDRAKELLDKLRVGELKTPTSTVIPEKVAVAAPAASAPRAPAAAEVPAAAAKPEVEKKPTGKPAIEAPPEGETVSAEKLMTMARGASLTELKQKFRGRNLTIIGIPSVSGRDANNAYVTFGSKVRFEFSRTAYDAIKDQVKAARENRTPLTIRGTVSDYTADGFIVRECQLQETAGNAAPEN